MITISLTDCKNAFEIFPKKKKKNQAETRYNIRKEESRKEMQDFADAMQAEPWQAPVIPLEKQSDEIYRDSEGDVHDSLLTQKVDRNSKPPPWIPI